MQSLLFFSRQEDMQYIVPGRSREMIQPITPLRDGRGCVRLLGS